MTGADTREAAATTALSVSESSGATSTNTVKSKSRLHDSIFMLEETTKSFLRIIRFDLELLTSREEEVRNELGKLESQYETFERTISKTEEDTIGVEEGADSKNEFAPVIDWVEHHEDGGETNEKEITTIVIPTEASAPDHLPKRQSQRSSFRCSRVDWGSTPIGDSFIDLYGDYESENEEISPEINDAKSREENKRQGSLFGNKEILTGQAAESTSVKKWWRFSFFDQSSRSKSDMTDTTIVTRTTEDHTPPLDEVPVVVSSSSAIPSEELLLSLPHSVTECDIGTNNVHTSSTCPAEAGDSHHHDLMKTRSDNMPALQLKLLGCDTAALSLNELLTCRERDRLDLQYELASLQQTVFYQQKYSAFEIDKLRQKLRQGKVERRRKSRILEDSREELKTSIKMEEQLAEELDSVRRELFMLKLQKDRQLG